MIRVFWLFAIAGLVLVNAGCGTLCQRPHCGPQAPPPKAVIVAPPAPSHLVPAGAGFGAPTPFPTAPAPGATFGAPSGFPMAPSNVPPAFTPAPSNVPPSFSPAPSNVPPSVTPPPSKSPEPPRSDSKWQPGVDRDVPPRIQLYAPEPIEKEKTPLDRKPTIRGTFPTIAQFAEVMPNVYTGLRPGADGLDWLQTNKVGAVVQIRLFGEDDAADKKAVEDRGMRYVAFEVSPQTLTKAKVDDFIKLVRDSLAAPPGGEGSGVRGAYVYDQDGSLAGSMWYLFLRYGETLNDETSQLRARGLGLQNTRDGQYRDMWLAVQKLLSEQ